jgi:hypothetical protein
MPLTFEPEWDENAALGKFDSIQTSRIFAAIPDRAAIPTPSRRALIFAVPSTLKFSSRGHGIEHRAVSTSSEHEQ